MNGMQIYVIPPLRHMDLSLLGDRLFALAQYVTEDNNQYVDFFLKNSDKFITIDSGTAEGNPVNSVELIERIKVIGADEVVCLDTLYNTDKTLQQTKDFISTLSKGEINSVSKVGVPQADNKKDFLKCVQKMNEMEEIDVIGLSRYSVPRCFTTKYDRTHSIKWSRIRCVRELLNHKLITKPIHLLGLGCPSELLYYTGYDFIRSNDSCVSVLSALHNIRFHRTIGLKPNQRPQTTKQYFGSELTVSQQNIAVENVRIVQNMTSRLNDFEKGYLSGFIDGEGWVGVAKQKRTSMKRGFKWSPFVQVSNTNLEVLKRVNEMCKNLGWVQMTSGHDSAKKRINRGWKVNFVCVFGSNPLRWLLPQIKDTLVIKKKQAEILLDILPLLESNLRHKNDLKINELYSQIRELNAK